METKPTSFDDSWTKHYLNKIESHERSGGISGYVASVKEAGMVPAAGLGDAAWHGWQAIKQRDGWHLVRSFTLLVTSVASLPMIIIAPNLIVATSDTLKIREQWDKPSKSVRLLDRVKNWVKSPQLWAGVALGASAIALYQLKYNVTDVAPNNIAEPKSFPISQILNILACVGLVAWPTFMQFRQSQGVGSEKINPPIKITPPIYDPEPTDPQAIYKESVLCNQDDTIVGKDGKCHIATDVKDGKVHIHDWSDKLPIDQDGTIYFKETELSYCPVAYRDGVNVLSADGQHIIVNGKECQHKWVRLDRQEAEEEVTEESPANTIAVKIDNQTEDLRLEWITKSITHTRKLKLRKANCRAFVSMIWNGEFKERPVCKCDEGDYVLVGNKHYYVQKHKQFGFEDEAERQYIQVDSQKIYLEYRYHSEDPN